MTTIFLSHSQADKELAHELATQIRKEFELPNEAVFVSSEPDGIPSGEWLEFVLNQLEKADIIIPLITPSSAKSMWVAFESNKPKTHQC